MHNQGEGELYNLLEDPEELSNIIKLKSSVVTDFRKEIKSLIRTSREKDITKEKAAESVTIDRVISERLRSLSYIQ